MGCIVQKYCCAPFGIRVSVNGGVCLKPLCGQRWGENKKHFPFTGATSAGFSYDKALFGRRSRQNVFIRKTEQEILHLLMKNISENVLSKLQILRSPIFFLFTSQHMCIPVAWTCWTSLTDWKIPFIKSFAITSLCFIIIYTLVMKSTSCWVLVAELRLTCRSGSSQRLWGSTASFKRCTIIMLLHLLKWVTKYGGITLFKYVYIINKCHIWM